MRGRAYCALFGLRNDPTCIMRAVIEKVVLVQMLLRTAAIALCQVAQAVADAVGPGKTGIRLSPFSNFLDATDPDTLDLNLYLMDKLSGMGLLYVHAVEPRISGASDAEPTDDSLEPLRKAFKVAGPPAMQMMGLLGPIALSAHWVFW